MYILTAHDYDWMSHLGLFATFAEANAAAESIGGHINIHKVDVGSVINLD